MNKWGNYFEVYERYLGPLRAKKDLKIIELGVAHGGSLQLWRKYFGPDARIAGIDINPKSEFSEGNTKVFLRSQADPATLERAIKWLGGVDVVIDDGSHVVTHQMGSLDYLFPRLPEGGIYICEDMHSNYWSAFEGGYRKKSTFIERMKNLIDDMYEWHHHRGAKDKTLRRQVFGVHFYDSMVVLEKRAITRPFNVKRGTPIY